MSEKGVPFMPAMALAVRSDDHPKTKTRRVVKAVVPVGIVDFCSYYHPKPGHWLYGWDKADKSLLEFAMRSPYGGPGDRLWVREHWRTFKSYDHQPPSKVPETSAIWYEADDKRAIGRPDLRGRFRHGMFMPRWASRTLLELTDVRVERLQAITNEDALAEGIHTWLASLYLDPKVSAADVEAMVARFGTGPRAVYAALWESINGAGSWALNPLVWVNTFKRIGEHE